MPLNAQVAISIVAHESSSGDMSRTLRVTPASYAAAISDGTGANQAQVAWSDSRTLAGSSETINLSSVSEVRDGATATISFTAVKALYVNNKSTATLTLTGAAAGASSGRSVEAGAVVVDVIPSAAGRSVSSIVVSGSAGSSYDIMVLGEGSVT